MNAVLSRATAFAGLLATLLCSGCHYAFGQRSTQQARWAVDDDRQIVLSQDLSLYPEWVDPELTYSEVTLAITAGDRTVHSRILGRRQGRQVRGLGSYRIPPLEARADQSREKVWLLERGSTRVIASYDSVTNVITGFDEQAPEWARPEAGVVLEPVGQQ